MPRAHGNDRLQLLPDGGFELHAPFDKGWRARRGRTRTTPEFPGTPVKWDDAWFEVVFLQRNSDGSRVYELREWPDEHPIRDPSHYDEESERARREELERTARRRTSARGIAVAGLVVGHVPAHAQKAIENEYGFLATRLSLISVVPVFLFAIWVATRLPIQGIPPPHVSRPTVMIAVILFVESLIRFVLVMAKGEPSGSVIGLVGYEVWRMTTARGRAFDERATVKADKSLASRSRSEADADTIAKDTYAIREPFLSLLSPDEQATLRSTYGFDPRAWGLRTASVIGLFAALGIWTSILRVIKGESTGWTLLSIALAVVLLVEQVRRLTIILGGRPAGSILGGLVRPWCRELFRAKSLPPE